MNAVVIHRFGGPEVLEIVELDIPAPGPGQVRVQVEAAAVNPVDIATRAGLLAEHGLMSANAQIGIGWDLAGAIDAVGPGVDQFEIGHRVIGMRDLLSLRDGQRLLVTGAAGALGGFALQLAALRGLRTIAVAGPADEPLVRGLGADEFVARSEDLGAAARRIVPGGVDGALDAALIGMPALDAVRDGGAFVAVSAGAAPVPLRGTRVENVWIRPDPAQLAELSALV